jgi:hypothetical protein
MSKMTYCILVYVDIYDSFSFSDLISNVVRSFNKDEKISKVITETDLTISIQSFNGEKYTVEFTVLV